MCRDHMTSIGFTEEQVQVGTHMCLVFSSEKERVDCLLKYMLSGMTQNEKSICFTERVSEDSVRSFFEENGISYDERIASGIMTFSGVSNVYFEGGVFDPQRMLDKLKAFYDLALDEGYAASRVIGEMMPEVETIPGGERLLEYESKVTQFVRINPITAICQYDANEFSGATIMEVLKVHPKMIVDGSVVNNPFFIDPEEYLKGISYE